jgi:protein-S-isoprenylcysteine O-methyltransferase Ste14
MMRPLWLEPIPAAFAFWLAYAACVVPELVGSLFQNAGARDRKQDRGSVAVIVGGTIVSLVLAFNLSQLLPGLRIIGGAMAMLIGGTAVIFAGVAFRWYAIRTLGRFFTRNVAIREDHRIIQAGPYRYLRHPSYSGYLLAMLGIGIALDNWPALLELVFINFTCFAYRIQVEEAVLLQAFGAAYDDYQRQTKRIIPLVY